MGGFNDKLLVAPVECLCLFAVHSSDYLLATALYFYISMFISICVMIPTRRITDVF